MGGGNQTFVADTSVEITLKRMQNFKHPNEILDLPRNMVTTFMIMMPD